MDNTKNRAGFGTVGHCGYTVARGSTRLLDYSTVRGLLTKVGGNDYSQAINRLSGRIRRLFHWQQQQ